MDIEPADTSSAPSTATSPAARRPVRAVLLAVFAVLLLYWAISYQALPALWGRYERHHPALELAQRRAFTAQGIPGDPINVAFVGTQGQLVEAALAAGWIPADPITWGTSARITVDALIHRAYANAPVSDLFVWGKKQDVAFEQPFGPDPSKRHHVRFWSSEELDAHGRPLWLGAATFDTRVGVSHRTGQVTHHIDADVDRERDKLAADFSRDAALALEWLSDFQPQRKGKNGGGDPYFTDGRICIARATADEGALDAIAHFMNPVIDAVKDASEAP